MFETMIDQATKKVFGHRGGLTHGDVIAQSRRDSLSNYLPYNYYDHKTKSFSCSDDNIGYIWECSPLYFVSNDITNRLQKFLQMKYPVDITISFHLYADPHIKDILDSYKSNKKGKDVIQKKSINEYSQHLMNGSRGLSQMAGTPVRNFRLWVSMKSFAGLTDDDLSNIEEALSACKLSPMRIDDSELMVFLRRLFNGGDNEDVSGAINHSFFLNWSSIF